jgi:magnesium transporter
VALVEPLGLHPVAVDSCLDEDQVPKFNEFPQHTFVLVNRFRYAAGKLETTELDALLGKAFLITVRHASPTEPAGQGTAHLDQAVEADLDAVRRGPDFLLHVVLDHAVDDTFHAVEALEDEIDQAQEAILQSVRAFQIEELIRLRRHLLALRKSLVHEREVLVKICRRDSPYIGDKAIYHFREVYDHLAKFFEVIEIGREMITSLMEMYLSMINNEMARSANSTNRVVRRLTLITTVFMPLTLLAGIGGMSEWSMMTGPQNWPVSYSLFLGAMVALGALNYFVLRWLERRSGDRG